MDKDRPDGVITDPVLVDLIFELKRALAPLRKKKRKLIAEPYALSKPISAKQPAKALSKPAKKLDQMSSAARAERLSEINRQLAEQDKKRMKREAKAKVRAAEKELRRQERASQLIERTCWRCKQKYKVSLEWKNAPTMCKACSKDIEQTYLPHGRDSSTLYSSVSFVPGGAPGGGKRR